MLEPEIKTYIEQLVAAYPNITNIWLLGSRANNTSHVDSDWDLLVFGSQDILKSLQNDSRFNLDSVDLLVVYNGMDFEKPWGEETKSGSLPGWDWKELNSNTATYRATKPIYSENGEEEFNVKVLQCRAVRVYP
jgi:predicted nucleotidyltransferase